MRRIIGLFFILSAAPESALAHNLYYFSLASEFGDLQSATGDQGCISAMEDLVNGLQKRAPKTITYTVWDNIITAYPEQGSVNPGNNNSFEIGLTEEMPNGYRYHRIFGGFLYRSSGKAEIDATLQNKSGVSACHLSYNAKFHFND